MYRSNIKTELWMRRFHKKADPVVLLALCLFAAWFAQMVEATATVPTVVNILR